MKKFKKIIFPVAGLGTRMAPISNFIPKEMLPILDKPVIHFAIQEALEAGFEELIFVTRPEKEIIKKYVVEMFPNVKSTFINQNEQKGLGHAILCAENEIDEPFGVLLPDDLILGSSCFIEMLNSYEIGNMVAAMEVSDDEVHRYGMLKLKSINKNILRAEKLVEKPKDFQESRNYAVIGRYLLDNSIFDFLKTIKNQNSGEIQISDAIDKMIQHGTNLNGYIFSGKRLDCGTIDGFAKAILKTLLNKKHYIEYAKDILK